MWYGNRNMEKQKFGNGNGETYFLKNIGNRNMEKHINMKTIGFFYKYQIL